MMTRLALWFVSYFFLLLDFPFLSTGVYLFIYIMKCTLYQLE